MTRRSSWGSVRRVSSGRFQARYRVAGVLHLAPHTFRTKREAHAFLAKARADVERGAWVDPYAGKIPLKARTLASRRQRLRSPLATLARIRANPAHGSAQHRGRAARHTLSTWGHREATTYRGQGLTPGPT